MDQLQVSLKIYAYTVRNSNSATVYWLRTFGNSDSVPVIGMCCCIDRLIFTTTITEGSGVFY